MSGIKIKFKVFYGRTSFVILFGIEHKNPIVPQIFAFYFRLLFVRSRVINAQLLTMLHLSKS